MHHVATQILRGVTSATSVKRPNLIAQEAGVEEEDMEVAVAALVEEVEDSEETEEEEVVVDVVAVDLEAEEGLDEVEIGEAAAQ